jgi:hypothetical protein
MRRISGQTRKAPLPPYRCIESRKWDKIQVTAHGWWRLSGSPPRYPTRSTHVPAFFPRRTALPSNGRRTGSSRRNTCGHPPKTVLQESGRTTHSLSASGRNIRASPRRDSIPPWGIEMGMRNGYDLYPTKFINLPDCVRSMKLMQSRHVAVRGSRQDGDLSDCEAAECICQEVRLNS